MYRNLSSLWYKRENEKKKHSEEAIIEFVNTNIKHLYCFHVRNEYFLTLIYAEIIILSYFAFLTRKVNLQNITMEMKSLFSNK